MADLPPEVERHNSAVTGLDRLRASSRDRVPPAPPTPEVTTLPDGRVLHRSGAVIFTPVTPFTGGKSK